MSGHRGRHQSQCLPSGPTSEQYSPDQLMLLVHGGAGVGKTKTIMNCANWAETYLRKPGDDPSKPRLLLLAFTGMAANLIGKLSFLLFL